MYAECVALSVKDWAIMIIVHASIFSFFANIYGDKNVLICYFFTACFLFVFLALCFMQNEGLFFDRLDKLEKKIDKKTKDEKE